MEQLKVTKISRQVISKSENRKFFRFLTLVDHLPPLDNTIDIRTDNSYKTHFTFSYLIIKLTK
jgi:hypothetical protein